MERGGAIVTKPTLDQERALHAWNSVTSFVKEGEDKARKYEDNAKEYAREARKMPMRIKASGLGPALAFINAKAESSKPTMKRLHQHLSEWVIQACATRSGPGGSAAERRSWRFPFPALGHGRDAELSGMAQPLHRGGRADGGLTVPAELSVTKDVKEVLDSVACGRHPGLQLDRFSPPGKQEEQKEALAAVCRSACDPELFGKLTERRGKHLQFLDARVCNYRTKSAMTLHLSRASALENAGICLHPLYGFTYLPGSGIKGMTRAYTETIWLPAQEDQIAAWIEIDDIFGWTPESGSPIDRGKEKKSCNRRHRLSRRLAGGMAEAACRHHQ